MRELGTQRLAKVSAMFVPFLRDGWLRELGMRRLSKVTLRVVFSLEGVAQSAWDTEACQRDVKGRPFH